MCGKYVIALTFDVTPLGIRYADELRREAGEAAEAVEAEVIRHLDFSGFPDRYEKAFRKWREAEQLLWSGDPEQELTKIGFLCREAMQEFAAVIAGRLVELGSEPPPGQTVARIREALRNRRQQLGETVADFLEALLVYWGTVVDLVQRQTHGTAKVGSPLRPEDARRVVFQLCS